MIHAPQLSIIGKSGAAVADRRSGSSGAWLWIPAFAGKRDGLGVTGMMKQ